MALQNLLNLRYDAWDTMALDQNLPTTPAWVYQRTYRNTLVQITKAASYQCHGLRFSVEACFNLNYRKGPDLSFPGFQLQTTISQGGLSSRHVWYVEEPLLYRGQESVIDDLKALQKTYLEPLRSWDLKAPCMLGVCPQEVLVFKDWAIQWLCAPVHLKFGVKHLLSGRFSCY
jgi:hypothetical protein